MNQTTQTTSINQLTEQKQKQDVSVGFTSLASFELLQRCANALAQTTLVPTQYQGNLPNCMIALNMASRIGADVLMVMQNLVVVHGRPTWSSQFLIATVNTCSRFSALRYEFFGENGKDTYGCRAWAVEKTTGEKLVGSDITIGLARREGWYDRKGSKWQTMPQQMLMYRSASWWQRAYAPELSMGLHTQEESEDIEYIEVNAQGDVEVATTTVKKQAEKIITPDADVIDVAPEAKPEPKAEPQESQAQDGTLEPKPQGGQSQMSLDDDFPL